MTAFNSNLQVTITVTAQPGNSKSQLTNIAAGLMLRTRLTPVGRGRLICATTKNDKLSHIHTRLSESVNS